MPALRVGNAIVPTGSNQSAELRALRRSESTISSLLQSIEADTEQVLGLYEALRCTLPLFGNARAGTWYVPHVTSEAACSFKSADGHYGKWSLSLRRPNLHMLWAALNARGAVIVDATRTGKRFPDALAKTVPIWCAAMTLLTMAASCEKCTSSCASCIDKVLHLPPFVPASERARIIALMPGWLDTWRKANVKLPSQLPLPLRPLWVTPGRPLWPDGLPSADELGFIPIVCVSASAPINTRRKDRPGRCQPTSHYGVQFPKREYSYVHVQGAGDDEENWALGLTSRLFWENRQRIFNMASSGNVAVMEVIRSIVKQSIPSYCSSITSGGRLLSARIDVCEVPDESVMQSFATSDYAAVIVLGLKPDDVEDMDGKVLCCPLVDRKGKQDRKYALCRELGAILRCMRDAAGCTLIVGCGKNGIDAATAVAVAWVSWHCDSSLTVIDTPRKRNEVNKERVHTAMLGVLAIRSDLAISRAALQQVNRFFQSPNPPSSFSDVHTS